MKMLTSLKTSFVVATFLVVSGTSYAMEPIPGEDRFAQSTGGDSSSFMAGATFGQIGDDVYMQISPRFEFSAGKWGLRPSGSAEPSGLGIPRRFNCDSARGLG